MVGLCFRWVLIALGTLLLVVAIFPVFAVLPVPEADVTNWVAAKLIMLPLGALCVMGAAGISARLRR